jgi:hypothetical protein
MNMPLSILLSLKNKHKNQPNITKVRTQMFQPMFVIATIVRITFMVFSTLSAWKSGTSSNIFCYFIFKNTTFLNLCLFLTLSMRFMVYLTYFARKRKHFGEDLLKSRYLTFKH